MKFTKLDKNGFHVLRVDKIYEFNDLDIKKVRQKV